MRTSHLIALLTASALGLSGCMTTLRDPSNPNRNAQTGALAGAAAGALVGIATGKSSESRTRGAIIGAVVGGAGGGLIGNQLDKQEAELRSQLGNNVGIKNTGSSLIVTMPQDILFATNSATLSGGLNTDLRTLATSLNQYPNSRVNITGHTDNTGDAGYNQTLSQRRAQAVASVLINSGVASHRLNATGLGESSPIANNLTPQGRAQNRRVEITIVPNG